MNRVSNYLWYYAFSFLYRITLPFKLNVCCLFVCQKAPLTYFVRPPIGPWTNINNNNNDLARDVNTSGYAHPPALGLWAARSTSLSLNFASPFGPKTDGIPAAINSHIFFLFWNSSKLDTSNYQFPQISLYICKIRPPSWWVVLVVWAGGGHCWSW